MRVYNEIDEVVVNHIVDSMERRVEALYKSRGQYTKYRGLRTYHDIIFIYL